MSSVKSALLRIEKWLTANKPEYLEELSLGLSYAAIDAATEKFSCVLPSDVRELYNWRNGSKGYARVFPYFEFFFPLEKVLKGTEGIAEAWDDWNPARVLIFDQNADVQYSVDPETNYVWFTDVECDVCEIHWNCLNDFISATAEAYEVGAYYVVENNSFWKIESNRSKIAEIWQKYSYQGTQI